MFGLLLLGLCRSSWDYPCVGEVVDQRVFVIGDEIDHYHDVILVTGIKQSALINDASRTPLAYAASECAIEDGHRGAGGRGRGPK